MDTEKQLEPSVKEELLNDHQLSWYPGISSSWSGSMIFQSGVFYSFCLSPPSKSTCGYSRPNQTTLNSLHSKTFNRIPAVEHLLSLLLQDTALVQVNKSESQIWVDHSLGTDSSCLEGFLPLLTLSDGILSIRIGRRNLAVH